MASSTGAGPADSARRVGCALAIVLVPCILAVAAWTSGEFPNRHDRYHFEHMGETILRGGTVYLDCWDNKPPGLPWWNAFVLWIGGGSTYAVTAACAMVGVAAVAITALGVARVLGRTVAAVTALIFALVLAQRYFDALTDGSEFHMMAADCAAATFAVWSLTARGGRAAGCALLAGVAWGVAGLFKQTGVVGPIAVAVCVIPATIYAPPPRGQWFLRALVAAVGAALVMGGAVLVLHEQGALREAYRAVVEVNLVPQTAGQRVGAFNLWRCVRQLEPINGVALLAVCGAIGGVVRSRAGAGTGAGHATLEPPTHARGLATLAGAAQGESREGAATSLEPTDPPGLSRGIVAFLIVWAVVAVWAVGVGPSHMPRYWHGLFAPLMWLVAQGVGQSLGVLGGVGGRLRITAAIGVLALTWIFFSPLVHNVYADALRAYHYQQDESERQRFMHVGESIRSLTSDDDHVFLWGYGAGIYRFSGRRCALRFSGIEKLDSDPAYGDWMSMEIFEGLRRDPPALVVMETQRYETLCDDLAGMVRMPGLSDWFHEHYAPHGVVDRFTFFVRRSEPAPQRPPTDLPRP